MVVGRLNRDASNMARITNRTCKVCRRLGMSVCGRERCALRRRNAPPGVHGGTMRRRGTTSGYAFQLQEKQKARHLYGLLERQFRNYVERAAARTGDTGLALQDMLERRLDNTVYRLGFTKTRAAARQLVRHGHVEINGKKLDIPSYQVNEGEVVRVAEKKRDTRLFDGVRKELDQKETPSWLKLDPTNWTGTVVGRPAEEELKSLFDPRPIIEFYSR